VRAALGRLDALVVIDVQESELTGLATHVLPATGQLERTDVTMFSQMSVRSAVQATAAVVAPVAERRPMWWALGALSDRLGTPSPLGAPVEEVTEDAFVRGLLARSPLGADAVLDAGPRGLDLPVEPGWVRETMLADGRWQLAPPPLVERLRAHREPGGGATVLTPRREMAWSNSVRYAGEGTEAVLRLHPDAARAAGVAAGARAQVTSEHGTLVATVAIDANVRADVASVVHGRRGRSAGRLTSATAEVDPLTGMPHASGVPVTVAPVPTDRDTA
jgi:anaerobic selenocysteine-containing dehydrogenase